MKDSDLSAGETPRIKLVAEVGSVHDGSFGNALRLIDAAAGCGADAVKFQTHIAAAETLPAAPNPPYFQAESRFDYFERTAFTMKQWGELRDACAVAGMEFLSSPFSLEAVDLLEEVGVEIYKVPSGEVTNLPLIERVAATGKPTLLSSGMSDWAELDAAVDILKPSVPLTIMQCTSAYPCPPERVGLNVLGEVRRRYALPVGFSDHSLGVAAALAAAALGATVIEKHFTFSRRMYGSDAANATEPEELHLLAQALRDLESMLAHPVDKNDLSPYRDMKKVFEKSIVTSRPIESGAVITGDDLSFKKPGDGISASRFREVIGRRTTRGLPAEHKLGPDDFS